MSVVLHWLEIIIATLVIAFVIVGIISMLIYANGLDLTNSGAGFYHNFEDLLSNVLLIIIDIEFAILLIRRSPESLVEVMFFVVARKMLIKTDSFYDLLLGVAAIAGLFAVRKYIEHTVPERQLLTVHTPEEEKSKK